MSSRRKGRSPGFFHPQQCRRASCKFPPQPHMGPFPEAGDGPALSRHGTTGQGCRMDGQMSLGCFRRIPVPPGQEPVVVGGTWEDLAHGEKIWGKNATKLWKARSLQHSPSSYNVRHWGLVQTIKVWFRSHGLIAATKLLCFFLVSALQNWFTLVLRVSFNRHRVAGRQEQHNHQLQLKVPQTSINKWWGN